MQKIITLLLLLAVQAAFGQGLSETFSTDVYTIRYPEKWILAEDGLGVTFHLVSPKDSESDPFRENVNLINQDLEGTNLDLDGYVKLYEDRIKNQIKGTITRSERLKSGSFELHKIVYDAKINGFDLKLVQHYQIQNGKAYVLTFTATQADYEKHKLIGQQILNSFRFN